MLGPRSVRFPLLVLTLVTTLHAAPRLRLSTAAVGPVSIAAGQAGITQTVEAWNEGDGSLNLSLRSSAAWAAATLGAFRSCTSRAGTCIPINIALQTASLPAGTETALIVLSDPNAVDAPQILTVTVHMGGSVPQSLTLYSVPDGFGEYSFTTNSRISARSSANWLSLASDGGGSFDFVLPYRIRAAFQPGMGEATYNGTLTVSGSSLAADNKAVAVTYRVTSQPIARLRENRLRFRIPQGNNTQTQYAILVNSGTGTLVPTGGADASGGTWLSTGSAISGFIPVTVKVDGLAAGFYRGTLNAVSNAVNGAQRVTVDLEVLAAGGPELDYRGITDNVTFVRGSKIAPGAIVAALGFRMSAVDPALAPSLPLPTELGGVRVLVNDQPAPIYYSSATQVNFQMPYNVPSGIAQVRVDRGSDRGNTVTVEIAERAPKLLRLGIADYGIIVNPDGSFPIAPTPGVASRPAAPGRGNRHLRLRPRPHVARSYSRHWRSRRRTLRPNRTSAGRHLRRRSAGNPRRCHAAVHRPDPQLRRPLPDQRHRPGKRAPRLRRSRYTRHERRFQQHRHHGDSMTERIYYTDAYAKTFSAAVVRTEDGGRRLYLDRTAFYPASGGQPSDKGTIAGIPVLDVIDEDEAVAHILEQPVEGAVECAIDWERRFDLMQQHSGQHLISAVFHELYGWETVSVHMGELASTVDLNVASIAPEEIERAELRANAIVAENRLLCVAFADAAEDLGLRKATARTGTIRVVSIEGLDRSACGGTHVRATGEIGAIAIRKSEKIRSSTRLEFFCGARAVRRARADYETIARVTQQFSAAQAETSRKLRKLEAELARYQARELYDAAPESNGLKLCIHSGESQDALRDLAQAYCTNPKALFLGTAQTTILIASSEDSGIACGPKLQAALKSRGLRGGGSPRLAQGSVTDPNQQAAILEELKKV